MDAEWEYSNTNIAYPFDDTSLSDSIKEAFVDALVLDDRDTALTTVLHALNLVSTTSATIDMRYSDGSAFFGGTPTFQYKTYGLWQVLSFSYSTKTVRLLMPVALMPYSMSTPASFCTRVQEAEPDVVQSITVTDAITSVAHVLQGNIVLYGGYNVELQDAVETELGGRTSSAFSLSATPGAGLGKLPGDCSRELLVRTINGVAPDEKGRFLIDGKDCYRASMSPSTYTGSTAAMSDNTIKLYNDCVECCSCEDYDNVYKALKRVHESGKLAGSRMANTVDGLSDAIGDWNDERRTRQIPRVSLDLRPTPGRVLGVQVNLLNNWTSTAINMHQTALNAKVELTVEGEKALGARVIEDSCYIFNSYYGDGWRKVARADILDEPQDFDDTLKIMLADDIEAGKTYHWVHKAQYLTVFFEIYFPNYSLSGTEDDPDDVITVTADSTTFRPASIEEETVLILNHITGYPEGS